MATAKLEYIPKDKLVAGQLYKCEARNFYIGMWTGDSFCYRRTKFGNTFEDVEHHYDDGPPHGTVKPIEEYFGN